MLSVFEAGDNVEAFLERLDDEEEAFANPRGDLSRAVYIDPDHEIVDDGDADVDDAAARALRVVVLAMRSETAMANESGALTPLDDLTRYRGRCIDSDSNDLTRYRGGCLNSSSPKSA